MISFCRHVDASFIRPRASEVTSFLLTYLRIDIKEEPLYLILETLNAVMRTDLAKLDSHSAEAIGEAVFDVWLRNATGSSIPTSLHRRLMCRSRRYGDCRGALRNDRLFVATPSHQCLGHTPLASTWSHYRYEYGSSRRSYSWGSGTTCQQHDKNTQRTTRERIDHWRNDTDCSLFAYDGRHGCCTGQYTFLGV